MSVHITTFTGKNTEVSRAIAEAQEQANELLSREKLVSMEVQTLHHQTFIHVITLVTEQPTEGQPFRAVTGGSRQTFTPR